ncbi:MAG: GTP 3',8-cyclase MoaA, partial [Deltaproteobacteria bacterium]
MTALRARGRPAASPSKLVDAVGRRVTYLRVSVTDRCNQRCTYCMPPEGIEHVSHAEILSFEETEAIVREFAALGVDTVRVTGGEPLVRKDVVSLFAGLAAVETATRDRLTVALSTNAERLSDHADALVQAGVRRFNVSLDSLDPARYRRVTRRGDLDRVRAGIAAVAGRTGVVVKTNTVAISGFNDDELHRIARFAWGLGAIPRFIETMPMHAGRLFVPGRLMAAAEIRERIAADLGARVVPTDAKDVPGSGPARYFDVVGGRGRVLGRIGIISPMTENFCAACNRVRLDSRGRLHGCLAADRTVDLRTALRRGGSAGLRAAIAE